MNLIDKLKTIKKSEVILVKDALKINKNISNIDVVKYEIGEYFLTKKNLYINTDDTVSSAILEMLDTDLDIPKNIFKIEVSGIKQLINLMQVVRADGASKKSTIQEYFFKIILDAVDREVTDISISYQDTKKLSAVRFRELGEMVEYKSLPSEMIKRMLPAVYMMCYGADSTYSVLDYQSGSMRAEDMPDVIQEKVSGIRMQFNPIHPQPSRELVCRIMQKAKNESNLSLKYLGFNNIQSESLLMSPRGLTLFSGPTGSGKSTALRAILQDFIVKYKGRKKIYTVEDPVEVEIPSTIQLTIANIKSPQDREEKTLDTLRALTRSDLDFGVIGEIRDLNGAKYSYQLASSGHPILSTFHASEANSIPSRLMSLGMDDYQVFDSSVLTKLISQRLVPVLCQFCAIEITLDAIKKEVKGDFIECLSNVFDGGKHILKIRGTGCEECSGRGINGRTVIAEIIETTSEYFNTYRNKGSDDAKKYWLKNMNGFDIRAHSLEKILSGEVDFKSIISGDTIGETGWII